MGFDNTYFSFYFTTMRTQPNLHHNPMRYRCVRHPHPNDNVSVDVEQHPPADANVAHAYFDPQATLRRVVLYSMVITILCCFLFTCILVDHRQPVSEKDYIFKGAAQRSKAEDVLRNITVVQFVSEKTNNTVVELGKAPQQAPQVLSKETRASRSIPQSFKPKVSPKLQNKNAEQNGSIAYV